MLKNYDPRCTIVESQDKFKFKVSSVEKIKYHPDLKAKDDNSEPLKK